MNTSVNPFTDGSLFKYVKDLGWYLYPNGTRDPGTELTFFPNDTTALRFNSKDVQMELALTVFTHILDADRELFHVRCIYPLSGQYSHLPRMLFYFLIVFAVMFRHRTTLAQAALGVVMSYSATACIHLFLLLGLYRFSEPADWSQDTVDATPYGDVDFWGIAPVVAVSAIVLIPILTWSESFKTDRGGKTIMVYWSLLIFASFSLICYHILKLGHWNISIIDSVASCKRDCPRPHNRGSNGPYGTMWSVEDYNSDACSCVDYCGLMSPNAPLRKNQGMTPRLYYGLVLNYLCDDQECDEPRSAPFQLLVAMWLLWTFALLMGLQALLGAVAFDSESARNAVFKAANAGRRETIGALFRGRRLEGALKWARLQGPRDSQAAHRRFRRLFAKLSATLYYGLAFFGLMVSPVLFIASILNMEFKLGTYSTSEHSDAVGSWSPGAAAALVLFSPLLGWLTAVVVSWVARGFEKIRLFVQYDAEERRQLDDPRTEKRPRVEPLIYESSAHLVYIMAHMRWYIIVRLKAFKAWWKDPETYSTMERNSSALDR